MKAEELQQYLAKLARSLPLDRYVERRFTALEDTGGIPVDMEFRFRGMLRDREPKLADVLKNSRVLILAEPGGGKSVVARAAVQHFAGDGARVPIFAELKAYRGDLLALITAAAPPAVCDPAAVVDGKPLSRAHRVPRQAALASYPLGLRVSRVLPGQKSKQRKWQRPPAAPPQP